MVKKRKIIYFICTGNTCRSPMAAGYMRRVLEDKGIKNIEVKTAGVSTVAGLLATPEAVQLLEACDVDLRRHRSSQLTLDAIKKADLIIGMTPYHVQSALRIDPEAKDKIVLLKEYTGSKKGNVQIPDPMGGTMEVYKKVFREIKSAADKLVKLPIIAGEAPVKRKAAKKTKEASTAGKSKRTQGKKSAAKAKTEKQTVGSRQKASEKKVPLKKAKPPAAKKPAKAKPVAAKKTAGQRSARPQNKKK